MRQSFRVTYVRQGATNTWSATTERGEVYRGIRFTGAVSYSTAWTGSDGEETPNFAIVSVLIELDPRFDNENTVVHPDIWKLLEGQAREAADGMFRGKHPEAEIVHEEDDD